MDALGPEAVADQARQQAARDRDGDAQHNALPARRRVVQDALSRASYHAVHDLLEPLHRAGGQGPAALERGARAYLRAPVGPELRERWYGWRPMSRDDIPLIGIAPGHRHLWLATGHGMMGVGMSAGTGHMLAALMAGRTPAVDPRAFDPARFA